MKTIRFNSDERQVLDWAITHRKIEPANDSARATCEALATRGYLVEEPGPDERFTRFAPSAILQKAINDIQKA